MTPLTLALALYAFFVIVGKAFLCLVRPRVSRLQAWLVSPSVGLALVLLAVMIPSQAGVPVRHYATTLLIGLLATSALALAFVRPGWPTRPLAAFGLVMLFSLLFAGWPALALGFNWVSYGNDDMANYCMAAVRFLNHGFFELPNAELSQGTDYTQATWFINGPGLIRFGNELLLAWVGGWTGKPPTQIVMPVILALSLTQLAALGALILAGGATIRQAVGAVALLAVSPIFLLGTFYQLIAQVGGLALMLALAALLMSPHLPGALTSATTHAVTAGTVAAALSIYYPEIVPPLGIGYGLFLVAEALRGRRPWPRVRIALMAVGIALLWVRYNALSFVFTVIRQAGFGLQPVGSEEALIFPYYLLPSGAAYLFGILPIAQWPAEPWASLLIGLGLGLLALSLLWAARQATGGAPHAFLLMTMFGLAVVLFARGADFGLYKLAMFMQPALAGTLACTLLAAGRRGGAAAMLALVALQLPAALFYAGRSMGATVGPFVELPHASARTLVPPLPPAGARVFADATQLVAAKHASVHLVGTPLRLFMADLAGQFVQLTSTPNDNHELRLLGWLHGLHPQGGTLGQAAGMARRWLRPEGAVDSELFGSSFSILDPAENPRDEDFLLSGPPELDLLNGLRPLIPEAGRYFALTPFADVRNRLAFVHSSRGPSFYLSRDRRKVAFYPPEADWFRASDNLFALGRFLLLRVERPSERVYIRLAVSRSVRGRNRTAWPSGAMVLGEEAVRVPIVGAGAANVFVGPLEPKPWLGARYLALDLNEDPRPFHEDPTGPVLGKLFNRDVPLDNRSAVAFGRDISCLAPEEYESLSRPDSVRTFPDDLLPPSRLEFSGWFEDGWISRMSYVVLRPARPGEKLRLRGEIPGLPPFTSAGQTLTIRVNDETPIIQRLPAGDFDLVFPVGATTGPTRVVLAFEADCPLPAPDDRPVSARVFSLTLA